MTEQQYEEQRERVKKYSDIKSEIYRLSNEKEKINRGVLTISCLYEAKIDCRCRYDEFRDNLIKSLTDFYDSEIERLEKQLEEL